MDSRDVFATPPGPPPLLNDDQLVHLARQGWLQIPLPEVLAENVAAVLDGAQLFFAAPHDLKRSIYPAKQLTELGYYVVPEEKEYVTFRYRAHTGHDASVGADQQMVLALESAVETLWKESAVLLWRILCDISRASELLESVWDDILDGTLEMPRSEGDMSYTLLRLFQYRAGSGHAEKHTDLGLLTLCIGDAEGLEVVDRATSTPGAPVWVSTTAGTKHGTILVGETLKALSSHSFVPGAHRVSPNSSGRHSVVFALRHSTRHEVDFGLFGGRGSVSPVALWKTLEVGKVNINMEREKREAQRMALNAKQAAACRRPTDLDGQNL